MNRKYTLITGASFGLGYAFAHEFAKKQHHLILVARNKEKLEEVKKELINTYDIYVEIIPCDLIKEENRYALFEQIKKKKLQVDILVNNAGFGDRNAYLETSWQRQKEMIELNILAIMHLTHLFGNEMKKKRCGKILNVSSVAAFSGGPNMSVYYASKSFVLSFSEAIYEELRKEGIQVSCLCPGPTKTEFEKNAHMKNSRMFKAFGSEDAKDVASYAYKQFMKNKSVIYHGKVTYGFNLCTRLLPRKLSRKISMKLNGGNS